MKIIHFSDLHYGTKYKASFERMLPALEKVLIDIKKKNKIDLIIFSGDLVWSGTSNSVFETVLDEFVKKLQNITNINNEEFIICAGNHDLSPALEMEAISQYIKNINTNEDLDVFSKNEDEQFQLSYKRSENYMNFVSSFYENANITRLYSVHKLNIENSKIGVVTFHSPWRSFIGNHKGHLLLPKQKIHEAISNIKDCKISICVMHHPLMDFKEYNRFEIEDIIYEKFHICLTGHYHKKTQGVIFTHDVGILNISSSATMSGYDGSQQGFSLIDLDVSTLDFSTTNFTYNQADNVFIKTSAVNHTIPMNTEKQKQVKLLKILKDIKIDVINESELLIVDYTHEFSDKSFLEIYDEPIIKNTPNNKKEDKKTETVSIKIDDLLEKNYQIFGKNKFGKTSLLRRIQIKLLEEYVNFKIFPIYIDLNFKKNIHIFSLTEYIRKALRISKSDAEKFIETSKIKFLFDNFDQKDFLHTSLIYNLENNYSNISFILTSEENNDNILLENDSRLSNYKKAYIYPLTKKTIRNHTEKILYNYDDDKINILINQTIQIFNQMSIPFNYWYLQLFLWVFQKQQNISIQDNIEILTLYIDKLLEREEIARSNKNIDYELFKILLGKLSYVLLTDHYNENYSLSYEELVVFINKFRSEHIRFVTDVKDIIDYVIDKGILKKLKSETRYTFRLAGVMEYFTALHMLDDQKFLYDTIGSIHYLRFGNELEIYAGLNRRDEELLKILYDKTQKKLEHLNSTHSTNPDNILNDKVKHSELLARGICEINVTDKDDSDQFKGEYEENPINNVEEIGETNCIKKHNTEQVSSKEHDYFYSHIFIFSRVFRTLSNITNRELLNHSFDLILNSFINLGFELLRNIASLDIVKDRDTVQDVINKVLDLLANFIPYVTQTMISEAVLHVNLKRLLEEKVRELEDDINNNQYKLTILYLMILDLDISENEYILDKIDNNIHNFTLKNIVTIKFMMYLSTRCKKNTSNYKKIKQLIVKMQSEIKPRLDTSKLSKDIDKNIQINRLSYE